MLTDTGFVPTKQASSALQSAVIVFY